MSSVPENPFPENIRTIGVAAPAGSADRAKYEESVRLIESFGIRVVSAPHLFSETPHASYLSATETERADDFNALLRNPEIDLIQCIRGGYGSMKILDRIDWGLLRERKLPVIGFSDITAVHLAMLAKHAGIPVAGQMTARFAEAMENPFTRNSFQTSLRFAMTGEGNLEFSSLKVLKEGTCTGPLIPANLTLLTALCGTPYLPDLTGSVLVIEEIGEPPRKIDRELTQLRLNGIFDRIAGLVFAQYTDCGSESELGVLFREFSQYVSGPVLCGLPFGHEIPSLTLPGGVEFTIQDGVLRSAKE